MSDKATLETMRAEALAWRHEAHRLRNVLAQIFDHMHPMHNGITDVKARYDAWEMAGKALNLPPWTADQADRLKEQA